MIVLGGIKRLLRLDRRDDGAFKDLRLIELSDIGLRDFGLLGILRKDRRTVLRAGVRTNPAFSSVGLWTTEKKICSNLP